jgi:hypothetical protein
MTAEINKTKMRWLRWYTTKNRRMILVFNERDRDGLDGRWMKKL